MRIRLKWFIGLGMLAGCLAIIFLDLVSSQPDRSNLFYTPDLQPKRIFPVFSDKNSFTDADLNKVCSIHSYFSEKSPLV